MADVHVVLPKVRWDGIFQQKFMLVWISSRFKENKIASFSTEFIDPLPLETM